MGEKGGGAQLFLQLHNKNSQAFKRQCLFYLCGGSIDSLVEALLSLIVALFVEPDVLRGEALQSTHVGTEEGSQKFRRNKMRALNCIQKFISQLAAIIRCLVFTASTISDKNSMSEHGSIRCLTRTLDTTGYYIMQSDRWSCAWNRERQTKAKQLSSCTQ